MTSDFEMDLSNIAFSYLQLKYSKIMDNIIGFEVIDSKEDESKGIGVFIANINKSYFYIPVFYINGQLKPIVLLYSAADNSFYPLDEDWISYFENKKVGDLGAIATEQETPDFKQNPINFQEIISPTYLKYSSKRLPEFLKEASNSVKALFMNLLKNNKRMIKYCASNYGIKKLTNACIPNANPKPKKKIEIISSMDKALNLTAFEKLAFVKDGYVAKDNRKANDLDKTYKIDYKGNVTSVTKDGIYNLPTNEGLTDVIIAVNPFRLTKETGEVEIGFIDSWEPKREQKVICVNTETGNWGLDDAIGIIAEPKIENSIEELILKMPSNSIKKMKLYKRYMIYDHTKKGETGHFSEPFVVNSITKGSDGSVSHDVTGDATFNHSILHIRERDKFSILEDEIFVPQGTMVIELKRNENDLKIIKEKRNENDLRIIKEKYIDSIINNDLKEIKVANLVLYEDGIFKKAYYKTSDAVVDIALKYNIPIYNIQKHIEDKNTFFVKRAVNEIYGTEKIEEAATPNTESIEKTQLPGNDISSNVEEDIRNIMALSETKGLKIFDESIIGILATLQNPGDIIKKYVPDLVKALDRLGKILFLLWYHGYKIKTDFDITEFGVFEDMIKDTFNNLGKLILKIHKKDLTKTI